MLKFCRLPQTTYFEVMTSWYSIWVCWLGKQNNPLWFGGHSTHGCLLFVLYLCQFCSVGCLNLDPCNLLEKSQSLVFTLLLVAPRKFHVVDSLNLQCLGKFTFLNYHSVHYTTVVLSAVGTVNIPEITLSFCRLYFNPPQVPQKSKILLCNSEYPGAPTTKLDDLS